MSKVFLIFFSFFFLSLLETPIAFRVRVLAAKPPRPPHPRTDRPRLLRGAVTPPHQKTLFGEIPPFPFRPALQGLPGTRPGRLEGIRRLRKTGKRGCSPPRSTFSFLFQFCIYFFFLTPRVFFDLPLPPAVLVARDPRCRPRCGRQAGRELSASARGGVARPTEGIYFPTFPLSPNGIVVSRRNTLLNG